MAIEYRAIACTEPQLDVDDAPQTNAWNVTYEWRDTASSNPLIQNYHSVEMASYTTLDTDTLPQARTKADDAIKAALGI